jgi:hypothetical protein
MLEQMTEILQDEWRGLYKDSWTGVIVPEAFAHPAKYSRSLIRFIYQHVTSCGWIHPSDVIVDPFGGVALGGFDAMRHGLNWIGCELEEKFVGLGNQNIALWNDRYSRMPNWGSARLLNGDSRKLASVIADVRIAVSSPPYIGSVNSGESGIDWDKARRPERWTGNRNRNGCQAAASHEMKYGDSEGQLGAMKEGDLQCAISSPPFPQPYTSGGGINVKGYGDGSDKVGERTYQSKGGNRSEGNLETMEAAGFDAAISSPPFENSLDRGVVNKQSRREYARAHGISNAEHGSPIDMESERLQEYGATEGNLGNQRGETFWSASRTILEQLHQVLAPNAHAVFVVKAFVRNKQIVDFPAQWAQLCEAVGFRLIHHHKALLTEEYGTQQTFQGEDKTLTVARKSFFRRLAESKGSPRIDWESVLCFEKLP